MNGWQAAGHTQGCVTLSLITMGEKHVHSLKALMCPLYASMVNICSGQKYSPGLHTGCLREDVYVCGCGCGCGRAGVAKETGSWRLKIIDERLDAQEKLCFHDWRCPPGPRPVPPSTVFTAALLQVTQKGGGGRIQDWTGARRRFRTPIAGN